MRGIRREEERKEEAGKGRGEENDKEREVAIGEERWNEKE